MSKKFRLYEPSVRNGVKQTFRSVYIFATRPTAETNFVPEHGATPGSATNGFTAYRPFVVRKKFLNDNKVDLAAKTNDVGTGQSQLGEWLEI
jgi:hypothetical protein